jgi:hypothetical protein
MKYLYYILYVSSLWLPIRASGQAPVVLTQQPQANTMTAPSTGAIQLTFSQVMSAQAASSVGLRITSAWRGLLPGTYAGAGTPALRFTPTQALLPGEPLQVTVTTRATSQAGVAPLAPTTYQFRTAVAGGNAQFLDEDIPVGILPTRIATGDINNDGNPDFVINRDGNGGILIRLGDGQGGFLPPAAPVPNQLASSPISQLALADANNDGNLDLFSVANSYSGEVLVRLGDGTGRFTISGSVSSATNLGGLAVGDLNGDGNADLLTTDGRANKVLVRLGNGRGGLTTAPDVPLTPYPDDVALADVNGDRKLDMVVLNYTSRASSVVVRLGDGTGNFTTPPTAEVPLTVGSSEITTGDVNGDGKVDFLATNFNTNSVSVHLSDGTGGFRTAPEVSVGQKPSVIALADLNRDGKLDFVTTLTSNASTTVSLRMGDGQGGFRVGSQPEVPVGIRPVALALSDINRDGQPDLLVGNTGYPSGAASGTFATVSVRLGDGAGRFVQLPAPRVAAAGFVQNVGVGDVNNDGRLDLLTLYSLLGGEWGVGVRLGTSTGTFVPPAAPTQAEVTGVGVFPYVIAVGDVNNDGKLDFVTNATIAGTSRPVTYVGDGTGGFQALPVATTGLIATNVTSMLLADLTGDGYLDLVLTTAAPSVNGTAIFLGDGTGIFSQRPTMQVTNGTGTSPTAVRVGDLNGDGKLDLLLATYSNTSSRGTVAVRLGDGSGNFTLPPSPTAAEVVLGYNATNALDLADLNGDGKLDFVAVSGSSAGGYDNYASVRLGDGKGGFLPAPVAELQLPTEHPTSVALGDVNGDGNVDLVVSTSLYSDEAVVRLGDGQGGFTTPATRGLVLAGAGIRSVQLADVDADGDLDMLLANRTDKSVSVRLNGRYTGSVLPTRVATEATPAGPFVVYPNPAHTTARVVGATGGEPLLLLDLLGREVHRYATNSLLDVTSVKPGLYLLRCGKQTTRLVVE